MDSSAPDAYASWVEWRASRVNQVDPDGVRDPHWMPGDCDIPLCRGECLAREVERDDTRS